jgi:trehalose 6-phosphate phosphatase
MGELFPHLTSTTVRLGKALSTRPRGLFTDIDGTISRIAPTPEEATLLPGIAALLGRSIAAFDLVAIVSGRAAEDAARMVGIDELLYIGNHGLEWYQPSTGSLVVNPAALPWLPRVDRVLHEISAPLEKRWPGLRVESKGATAAIHLRGTGAPAVAAAEVYRDALAAAEGTGLRVTQGRMVVELRPAVDIDKGSAVAAMIRERSLAAALYLGDDRTDLDAFRELRVLTEEGACQGISVAVRSDEVGADVAAVADVEVAGVEQVPAFLSWLLEPTERMERMERMERVDR